MVVCGYDRDLIVIKDVLVDVFLGLVVFLERYDKVLVEFGIFFGGGFRVVRKVFGWFVVLKVVRVVIVVVRLFKVKDVI